jgi:hypothetical protein
MSFVNRYLPYFWLGLITHPLSVLEHFQSLLTKCSHGDQIFDLPSFSGACTAPSVVCAFSVPRVLFNFLFTLFFFFFCGAGGQSVQGAILVCRRGGCGYTM